MIFILSHSFSQNFNKKLKPKVVVIKFDIYIYYYPLKFQMIISHIFKLNLLIKFCKDGLFIIEVIFTNFYEKIHPFSPENRGYWGKLEEMSNGDDLSSQRVNTREPTVMSCESGEESIELGLGVF